MSDSPEIKGMEISDMKRQILERLKKNAAEPSVPEIDRPAISREDLLKAIKDPNQTSSGYSQVTATVDDGLVKRCEELQSELSRKNEAIQDLLKKVDEAKRTMVIDEETLRNKKTSEVVKLMREVEAAKKSVAENQAKLNTLQSENKKALAARDEALKQHDKMRKDFEGKTREVQDLEKRLKEERDRSAASAEMLKVRDKRVSDADKLARELEDANKQRDEYRIKYDNAQAETKRLLTAGEEASANIAKLKEELSQREIFVQSLQKKYAAEVDEIGKERDKGASNVESLRSKLYTATKDIKEHLAKISQLEEVFRSKDKRIAELDKICVELNTVKNDLESKLRLSESGGKELEEKYAKLNGEFAEVRVRAEQTEKAHSDLEGVYRDTSLQLQAALRAKTELEAKLAQMHLELEAKTARLTDADNLYRELDAAVHDLTSKFQVSQLRTKELEASNGDLALQLANLHRDKKILEARVSQLASESEAKTLRLDGADKLHNEMESLIKDSATMIQENQRRIDELEDSSASLTGSLKEALNKLKETEEKASREMDRLDAEASSLKNTIRQSEKREMELRSSIEHFQSEIQARDTKIEGDLRYTEKIVREINELRKKVASMERLPDRNKIAGA